MRGAQGVQKLWRPPQQSAMHQAYARRVRGVFDYAVDSRQCRQKEAICASDAALLLI